ncbi:hypothetical protein [Mucilaginibacter rubeus]|uniref:HNH endonuclease n=1 Tax=Mucilaginibacter rubeus TaxID=2027860 RepID=A0A5C1HU49_9SPHI|nr:hypothetical protein [Mucilaginibacter rubeus]QEM09089.1 hypothetical protein DEO27_003345 [Mucilaginibacter rubeus]
MITIFSAELEQLITKSFKTEIDTQEADMIGRLNTLLNDKTVVKLKWHEKYIQEIIKPANKIIINKFSELEKLMPVFDKIVSPIIISSKRHKKFRERLLKEMGYSDNRSKLYARFYRALGLKACVYCNAQLTVAVDAESYDKRKKTATAVVSAKFQVDHHLAKSEYPCFSVSYYNLYPVCATCNNIKRANPVKFKLYNEGTTPNTSVYSFALKAGSQAKYELSLDINDIEIIFTDPDKPNATYVLGSLTDTFDIKGIYDTQKDVVEEVILRSRIYNDSYKQTLLTEFPKLFNMSNLSDRVLLGTYADSEDIHKRPLTKFIQDIAKGLNKV